MSKISVMIQEEPNYSALVIPPEHLSQFREMVRRGMAYEWGQHEELYRFTTEFLEGWTPQRSVTGHTKSVGFFADKS